MELKKAPTTLDRGTSWITYCDPGIGKTHMLRTLPDHEKTIVIICEANIAPLMGTDITIFNLLDVAAREPYKGNVMKCFEDIYKFLRTEKHPFKYVAFDNISEMEQLVIQWLTFSRRKEFTTVKEYGDASCKMREYIQCLRDLQFQGITVVVNAWEMIFKIKDQDSVVQSQIIPKISEKVSREMCGKFDFVGHLEVYEKSGQRWVRYGPNDACLTKLGLCGLEGGEVPDYSVLLGKVNGYDYGKQEEQERRKE